jgi:septum formation inhibitor-activating ATPase MinD
MDAVARRHLGRSIPLAGVIPFDFSVVAAVKRRRPLSLIAGDTPAAVAIRDLARTLLEGDDPSSTASRPERGFLAGLLRAFRRS